MTLRRPGSNKEGGYIRTHAIFNVGQSARSCGKCGQFRGISDTSWKKHRVLGWVADCCIKEKSNV